MNHGWQKKRFGDLCEIVRGGSPRPIQSYLTNSVDGLNWIKIGDVAPGSKYITSTKEKIKVEGLSKTRKVFKGDFILSNSMSFGRTYILKIDGCIHDGWLAIKNVEIHFNPDFLFYFLSSPTTYSEFERLVKGGVVSNLNSDIVKGLVVPVPPIDIQERIVRELDKLNELIELKRNQLKDLDTLAQSLFYETFGGPLENSKRWNVGTLSEYANFKNGLNFTPADDGNMIKCLGVGDFKSNRYITADNLPEINIVEAVSEEYLLKDGDIILVRSNGNKALIGRNIMYVSDNSQATFSGFCIRCRYNRETLAPLFLSYYLSCSAIREYITSQGRGCNISNLNQKILSGIPLILPPLALQNEFAERIDAIEEQKRLIESSITDMETLLASRMDYWFND